MNPSILLFVFALNVAVYAQTPDYFENNAAICTGFYDGGGGGGSDAYSESSVIRFLDSEEYPGYREALKTYRRYYTETGSTLTGTQSLMHVRQEGRAIYYYDLTSETDSLLINYDLEIGDTVKGRYRYENPNLVIQHIDSVLVGANYRLLLYTDTLYPEETIHLIEGIGYIN